MSQTIHSFFILLLLPLTGCAGLQKPVKEGQPISNGERRRAAVEQFEQSRDYAQLQAAKSRLECGDNKGCREALAQLLARNPRQLEGRLMLAEVLLSDQQLDAAEEQFRKAAELQPNDARIEHGLGPALEAQGRSAEAIAQFQRALELAPQDELYLLSLQTAQGLTPAVR